MSGLELCADYGDVLMALRGGYRAERHAKVMTDSEFTILLARQRSGTHPLRDVLLSHPEILCTPEVFHNRPLIESDPLAGERMNFFRFLQRDPVANVARAAAPEHQEAVFRSFLAYLDGLSDARHVVVDVKYNSTHHFDGPWRDIPTPPAFFALVKQHGLRVLHLTRRNHLRAVLSLWKGTRTQTWFEEAPGPEEPIAVDVERLLARLRLASTESGVVERALRGHSRCLTVEYTEMFPTSDGEITPEVLDRIAAWLDVDPQRFNRMPRHRKQSALPLSEAIENYDEVEAALRRTRFEAFLEDEPAYRTGARAL